MKSIFERELEGQTIRTDDPEYKKIKAIIDESIKLCHEFNVGPFDKKRHKEILTKIFGKEFDDSNTIIPPFNVDYGKNIFLGKNIWIQHGCTFFDRGKITIGNNVFIAPRVNLITLNHAFDPTIRSATICKPIVIEDGVWIGTNSTILQGVTIGKNSVVGANSLVTKDVPPNVVVVGSPARIIKKI